jgi:hypothetical protein
MADFARAFADAGYRYHDVPISLKATNKLWQRRICDEPELFVNWWQYDDCPPSPRRTMFQAEAQVADTTKTLNIEMFNFTDSEVAAWIPRIEAIVLKLRDCYLEALNG